MKSLFVFFLCAALCLGQVAHAATQQIAIRQAFHLTVTNTPQVMLASRMNGDNRAYLSLANQTSGVTVRIAPDVEYNSPSFDINNSGKPVTSEYWEQPYATPGNSFVIWVAPGTGTPNGLTAVVTVWEG